MDPVHPIAPGPPVFPQSGPDAVQRLDPVTREQRREEREQQQRRRRTSSSQPAGEDEERDEEHPHIDVQA